SGNAIGAAGDQFHYVWRDFVGPGTVVARVTGAAANSDGAPLPSSMSGLMIRDSAATTVPFVSLLHVPSEGLQMLCRDAVATTALQVGSTINLTPPYWMRLVRSNNTFRAYYSTTPNAPTPAEWVLIGSHASGVTSDAIAGLAACSRDNTRLVTASFNAVAITSPAEDWRHTWFGTVTNSGDAADDADPDQDGVKNALERAFGSNPTMADNNRPVGRVAEGQFVLSYQRNLEATDLTYEVSWSTDLANWSIAGITDTAVSVANSVEHREAVIGQSEGNPIFLRLIIK
ncbi:MAG TPA: hypothetical protein VN673_02755, partial [Clostridia bacterium]|nr:hypothetical protein [Clostridia bacterium]